MIYKEEIRDLFSVPDDYYLAHCISADFVLGAGIAVEFAKRFKMKLRLLELYPYYIKNNNGCADCLLVGRVFNLVTKERYYHKPTYESLTAALLVMKELAERTGVTKIAMPVIGCGLDRLQWDRVSNIIKDVFKDTDIEILVCKMN